MDRIQNRMIEEFLTTRYPRCNITFFDFDGCFAVSCSSCKCAFFGWCLADCGTDAHSHVRTCTAEPKGADAYFGTRSQFVDIQRKRPKKLVTIFLVSLDAGDRTAALSSIQGNSRRPPRPRHSDSNACMIN